MARAHEVQVSEPDAPTAGGWRLVDIVVLAVLGVAFGVVFWGWNTLWNTTSTAFAGFAPAQGLMYGVWLLPGVLGGLVVRRPGAAVFTELVASVVSALLGSSWGLQVVWYGLLEGLAPELVFAAFRYRRWGWTPTLLAAAAAGAVAAFLDRHYYYAGWSSGWFTTYLALVVASSVVVAGLLARYLVRALAGTGVLAPFASGREAGRV